MGRKYGIYEKGQYLSRLDGVTTREYAVWGNMIQRTHPGKLWQRIPSYVGCSCSELFLHFQEFAKWANSQVGWKEEWELDKDVLFKGNKVYSENTCVFLPHELNSILCSSRSNRGEHPVGVHYNKMTGKFQSYCKNCSDKRVNLGNYPTVDEAFLAHKTYKESFIKQQAEKWKDQIDPRAYEALMRYEVLITD